MHTIHHTVAVSDIGADKKMKVPAVVAVIGDCEQFQLDRAEYFSRYYEKNGLGLFLNSRQVDFLRIPDYGERLTVTTYVYEMNGFYGSRNTFVYDEKGETIVKTYAVGTTVDLKTGRPARVPEDVVAHVIGDERQDIECLERRVKLPDAEPAARPAFTVPQFFIDFYGHMNNVHYITLAYESAGCPPVKRFRSEYKAAAARGDTIVPLVYQADGITAVSLTDGKGKTYVNVEFVLK